MDKNVYNNNILCRKKSPPFTQIHLGEVEEMNALFKKKERKGCGCLNAHALSLRAAYVLEPNTGVSFFEVAKI